MQNGTTINGRQVDEMTQHSPEYLVGLVRELVKNPAETSWLEFKHNNQDPQVIGEYISALANAVAVEGKANAYMLWGIDVSSRDIVGTGRARNVPTGCDVPSVGCNIPTRDTMELTNDII